MGFDVVTFVCILSFPRFHIVLRSYFIVHHKTLHEEHSRNVYILFYLHIVQLSISCWEWGWCYQERFIFSLKKKSLSWISLVPLKLLRQVFRFICPSHPSFILAINIQSPWYICANSHPSYLYIFINGDILFQSPCVTSVEYTWTSIWSLKPEHIKSYATEKEVQQIKLWLAKQ